MKQYQSYKDSGVAWIGRIPATWTIDRMKFLLKRNDGGVWGGDYDGIEQNATKVFRSTEINIDGSWDLNEEPAVRILSEQERQKALLREGDLLVTKSSGSELHIGKTALVNNEIESLQCCYSNFMQRLRPIHKDSAMYLHIFLNSQLSRDQYNCLSNSTTGLANLSSELLNEILIPSPPEEEKKAIGNYLERKTAAIDDLIAKKERMIELLEEERAAVINQAVTRGLDANVELKDSGVEWLEKIPTHWEVKRLKYAVHGRLEYGANESAELDDEMLPRYIRITDFDDNGNLRDDTFKSLPEYTAQGYLLEEGDVLFARSGATVGKTFQFKNYSGRACFAGYLIKARPNQKVLLSDFLYYFTRSNTYENWKNSIFNQATIQNIGADKYAALRMPIPPVPEQRRIVDFLDSKTSRIDAQVSREKRAIELLKEYRTALISEVVTGKIDVRNEVNG